MPIRKFSNLQRLKQQHIQASHNNIFLFLKYINYGILCTITLKQVHFKLFKQAQFSKFSSRRRQPWCRLLLRRVIILLVRLTINYPFLINKLLGSKPNLLSTQAMYDVGDPQSQIAKYWDMNTAYTSQGGGGQAFGGGGVKFFWSSWGGVRNFFGHVEGGCEIFFGFFKISSTPTQQILYDHSLTNQF